MCYVLKESSLPKDYHEAFPPDMNKLGLTINDKDQIRLIKFPDQPFHYHCSTNERIVEIHSESYDTLLRNIVEKRLGDEGLVKLRLPVGVPVDEPHVPIFTSSNLEKCSRVVVFFGEAEKDMGILAGRLITADSIDNGTCVSWIKHFNEHVNVSGDVAVVIANPCQRIWHRRGGKALSIKSWNALPRPNALASGPKDGEENRILRNEDAAEHFACLFEDVIKPLVDRGCKVDIIGVADGAWHVRGFLDEHWDEYKMGIDTMVNLSDYVETVELKNKEFLNWFGDRARAYITSSAPVGTPLRAREQYKCNVYSAQVTPHVESIMPKVYPWILDYFKVVASDTRYVNEEIPDLPEMGQEMGGSVSDLEDSGPEVNMVGNNVYMYTGKDRATVTPKGHRSIVEDNPTDDGSSSEESANDNDEAGEEQSAPSVGAHTTKAVDFLAATDKHDTEESNSSQPAQSAASIAAVEELTRRAAATEIPAIAKHDKGYDGDEETEGKPKPRRNTTTKKPTWAG